MTGHFTSETLYCATPTEWVGGWSTELVRTFWRTTFKNLLTVQNFIQPQKGTATRNLPWLYLTRKKSCYLTCVSCVNCREVWIECVRDVWQAWLKVNFFIHMKIKVKVSLCHLYLRRKGTQCPVNRRLNEPQSCGEDIKFLPPPGL
jgi:hypothetical protein